MHLAAQITLTAAVFIFSSDWISTASIAGLEKSSPLICLFHEEKKSSGVTASWEKRLQPVPLSELSVDHDEDEILGTLRPMLTTPAPVFQDKDGRNLIQCKSSVTCYTLWRDVKPAGSNITEKELMHAGCWNSNGEGQTECLVGVCSGQKHSSKSTRFCCCEGSYCNLNYTNAVDPEPQPITNVNVKLPAAARPMEQQDSNLQTYLILAALVALGLLIISGFFFMRHRYHNLKPEFASSKEDDLKGLSISEAFPGRIFADRSPLVADDVHNLEKLAQGQYGEVYKALVEDRTVAVKKFDPKNREYFLNECRVYNLPFMEHDALLKFLAATEHRAEPAGLVTEYWLVLEYHPNRTLMEYLKQRTIDSFTLTEMALSLASGLAYLHSELTRDGVTKPSIVHRDLNSRNILVREDLRLCICDMGFALALGSSTGMRSPLSGSESSSSGSHDEELPVQVDNHVGTVRYMAPEVLEGSLNLRDSGAALRQVDVYAFGLTLWELSTRCADIYQGSPVPEYQLPFQKETGPKPTFSVMQTLVAKRKARPLFSDMWKDNYGVVLFLKDTMEECWDGDAEARLTAKCVEERLLDLSASLKPHQTINNLKPASLAPTAPLNVIAPSLVEEELTETMRLLENIGEAILPPFKNVNELREGIYNSIPVPSRVQPHQGRNPCFERNTKMESSEELTSSGNNLIGKKTGQRKNPSPPELSDGAWNRVIENAENVLMANRNGASVTAPAGNENKRGRQKKIPNVLAAEQNKCERGGFFGLFKKNNDSNNLLKYRAVPMGSGAGSNGTIPHHVTAIQMGLDASNNKCNIRTAATLLPQMLRGRGQVAHEGSNSTQLTCLSPSPSTSGNSPPRGLTGEFRSPRFSAVRDENDDDDDLDHFSPAVLIHVPSQSIIRGGLDEL